MRVAIIMFFVVGSLVHTSHGTFDQFVTSIPEKIGNAISSAWYSILDAIKKPVRMKKLGPGAKPKVKTRVKAVTLDPHIWQQTDPTRTSIRLQDLFRRRNTDEDSTHILSEDTFKVTLPLLTLPKQNQLEGRYKFRQRDNEDEIQSMRAKSIFPDFSPDPVTERNVKEPDENHFGHLIFI